MNLLYIFLLQIREVSIYFTPLLQYNIKILIEGGNMMTKTLDDMKMVHEEEMQNYDRMQEAVTRVMH